MPDDTPKNVVQFKPQDKEGAQPSAAEQAKAAHKKEMMQRLLDGGKQLRRRAMHEHAAYYSAVFIYIFVLSVLYAYNVWGW